MFNGLFGLGRAYKTLPPHHSFGELADNIEALSSYLHDVSVRKSVDGPWQTKLATDLDTLLKYARGFVPPDTDCLHYFSGSGKR